MSWKLQKIFDPKWDITDNTCNIKELLELDTILPSKGVSPTISATGTLKPMAVSGVINDYLSKNKSEVFMKILVDKDVNKELQIEIYLYRFMEYLRTKHITDNTVIFIADLECWIRNNSVVDKSGNSLAVKYFRKKEEMRAPHGPTFPMKAAYLLTKPVYFNSSKKEVVSFEDFVKSRTPDQLEMEKVHVFSLIFQVLYTLHEFHLAGIRHNDCHMGNILIEKVDESDFNYVIKNERGEIRGVTVSGKYKARLFDYDHSTFTDVNDPRVTNPLLNGPKDYLCAGVGECPESNEKFDSVLFLSWASMYFNKWPTYNNWTDKITNNKTDILNYGGYDAKTRINPYQQGWIGHTCKKDFLDRCYNLLLTDDEFLPFNRLYKTIPFIKVYSGQQLSKTIRADDYHDNWRSKRIWISQEVGGPEGFYKFLNDEQGMEID